MAMTDLQQDPWKLRLVKYYLDIYVLCLFKMFILIYICGFSVKVTCAFRVYKKQWRNSQNKHVFRVKKTTLSSTVLIRLSFKSTVVNRALSSLHGWLLKFILTVPLIRDLALDIVFFIRVKKLRLRGSNFLLCEKGCGGGRGGKGGLPAWRGGSAWVWIVWYLFKIFKLKFPTLNGSNFDYFHLYSCE